MDIRRVSCRSGAHAGGSVSFKLFNNKSCDASEGGLIASDGPVPVDGNGEYPTPDRKSVVQGKSVDLGGPRIIKKKNKEASSGCADEQGLIGPASPKVETTQAPASGTVGEPFKDNAKLSGLFGAHAGGSVSFKLFNNKSCDASEGGLIASDGPVPVDGNGEYPTPHGASPTQAGTYYWVATYSGDPNNKEAVSGCADEPVKIGPATPTVEDRQSVVYGKSGDLGGRRIIKRSMYGEYL